jgi:site-specific DNA-methyltransferase (adenine-specific)
MIEPYYSDDFVTIYHGDCKEILPGLSFDVVITDPPYGIEVVKNGKVGIKGLAEPRKYREVVGDTEKLDPTWLASFGASQVIFGLEHFVKIPHSGQLLVWDKEVSNGLFAEVEIAWHSKNAPSKIIKHQQQGFVANLGDIGRHHPTQKPLAVMLWLVKNCSNLEDVIVDPYMGTGTTLRAAKDLGRKAIGIEIDEQYCEIAVKRLAQEVLFA